MNHPAPANGAAALPLPVVAPVTVPVAGRDQAFAVRRIYCVGRNYIEHIREMKEGDERDPPFFFQKPTDAIVTDGQVPYPVLTEDFQFELELVIAIGRTPDPDPTQSLSAVFGYAVGLDMTRRDRQREAFREGRPWEVGKSFDASAPCGPILPVEAGGHVLAGPLTLEVNGRVAQQSDLGKMIWNVPEIIVQLSRQYRLMPGDLIYTGTPAGVGAVQVGDRLHGRVAGLPELDVTIVAAR
ncbi:MULTISPECIES: fumarylacetoacetate hydrolase family protein [Achromobacter]|uniref:Fumarylacetoacetate (FAA) hydrolase family protein 14 n=1 Tax=Achromobacter xylosoxidans (strain A8) TaxID=762376 RepID=E3HYH7_ACHXA|nr:fumarylacetoacetate hydrolase family protein [Achromobacter xylosoxidans]ADP20131.1 fumarylacetoacetate (FAA) hydrolase family protein 14 [Achromobacter xylosoxidans A8]